MPSLLNTSTMYYTHYTPHTHQEGPTSYPSGDVPVECVRLMPVSLTATRGLRTACTGAQQEPARVEPPGLPRSQEGSQPFSPSRNRIQFICPLCPRDKTYQGTAASVATHKREAHPGEGNSFLKKNSGDRCRRHAARIGTVSVSNAVTFTRTSADTRVDAIEQPQTPYPRIQMDWVASPLRETQTRPRPLQRNILTKVNSLHRASFAVGNRRCGAHARCSRRNNPCQDASLHSKNDSPGAPNALCLQPEACPKHFLSSPQCSIYR